MNTLPIRYEIAKSAKETIEYFYERESDQWHEEVHKRGGSCKENVYDMLHTISDGAIVYEVWVGEELAAFFTYFAAENGQKFMEAFHVLKKFRRSWFLEDFWRLVRRVYSEPISIGVPEQNKAAIEHLQRQGFEYKRTIKDKHTSFFLLTLNV